VYRRGDDRVLPDEVAADDGAFICNVFAGGKTSLYRNLQKYS